MQLKEVHEHCMCVSCQMQTGTVLHVCTWVCTTYLSAVLQMKSRNYVMQMQSRHYVSYQVVAAVA